MCLFLELKCGNVDDNCVMSATVCLKIFSRQRMEQQQQQQQQQQKCQQQQQQQKCQQHQQVMVVAMVDRMSWKRSAAETETSV